VHQLHAGHAGQQVIGDQQIDRLAAGREHGLLTRRCLDDLQFLIIQGIQRGVQQPQDIALVINEQDGWRHSG
jgi:hypothetical protein